MKNKPENNELDKQGSVSDNSAHIKKVILYIFAGMVAFVILFYIFSSVINVEELLSSINKDRYNSTKQTIIFFEPNYDENIFEDTKYMGLDRNIYIYDIATGVTESLEQEDYEEYSDAVKLMVDLINSIINGDAATYNEFFSSECVDGGYVQLKEAFTMQKLYNIQITLLSEEDNDNYTKYEFILEYMIMQNNGTFRTDIDSNASKKQYITITDRTGELLIDSIVTPNSK